MIHGQAGGVDDFGYPVPAVADRQVQAKSVQPLSLEELQGQGRDGTVDVLRVWLPRGEVVQPDDEVTIRGRRYRVEKTAWDWGAHRRPVLARHRPGVVFDCVRGAG